MYLELVAFFLQPLEVVDGFLEETARLQQKHLAYRRRKRALQVRITSHIVAGNPLRITGKLYKS